MSRECLRESSKSRDTWYFDLEKKMVKQSSDSDMSSFSARRFQAQLILSCQIWQLLAHVGRCIGSRKATSSAETGTEHTVQQTQRWRQGNQRGNTTSICHSRQVFLPLAMMRLRLLLPLLLAGAQKSRQRQACGNSARPEQTIKSVQKEGERLVFWTREGKEAEKKEAIDFARMKRR